ncbi:hypothetical protein [Candidatus Neptunochlamydia vexilliferae]|uniref:hypothetical protein n=1 Tax=Candidatus Neptunichlamydia vexilliferae TaxID=1651774 RepID=UPI0018912493|nr:hypothetical protein [Candidatus Neptunochlamydia vexilliferae]
MRRTLYRYARRFQGGMREGLLLRLEKGTRVGWGEIAPLPGFSKETLGDVLQGKPCPSAEWGWAAAKLDLAEPLDVASIPVRVLHQDKLKVGHLSLDAAIDLGKKTPFCTVDMNQKWPLEKALAFAEAFPHVECFEEPLKEEEDATAFPYPVALDESVKHPPPYPHVIVDTIKPTLLGYPLPKPRKGVDFILSSSYESELGIYQIAKLAYRMKIPLKPMGLGTCHLFEEPLFEEGVHVKEGVLYFPKKWRLKIDQVEVIVDGTI